MDKEKLQVENGNFTRITNPLIEELIKIPFKGCELAVALHIIRKTYGFNKKQDEISLTQFEKALERSRPVIVKALKNLQLVKVVKLVKPGTSKKSSNLWEINKYFETWKLVKVAKLVKHKHSTSKGKSNKLVKVPLHTKDNIQKTTTKDILQTEVCGNEINFLLNEFKQISPMINFGNKTQRKALEEMINEMGYEKTLTATKYAISVQAKKFAPTITTPVELKNKLGAVRVFYNKNNKSNSIIL